jgi:hypothetical protein
LFAVTPPSSCNGLPSGLYNITIRGYSVVELWCQSNKAFLVLPPRTTNDTNYSEQDGVRTYFCAVRLDPPTLLVDVGDLTFAEPIVSRMPVVFANAAECRGVKNVFSFFNVDMRGTVFQLANDTTVTTFGWTPQNSSAVTEAFKVLSARVYGFCGGSYLGERTLVDYGISASPGGGGTEVYCRNLQWRLSLVLTQPDVPGAVLAQPCTLPAGLSGNLTCNATLRVSPPPLVSSICPPTPSASAATSASASTATQTIVPTSAPMNTSKETTVHSVGSPGANFTVANNGDSGTDVVSIVWGVIGAVLILTVIGGLAFVFVRRRNRRDSPPPLALPDDGRHSAGDFAAPLPLTIDSIPSDDPMAVVAVSGRSPPHGAAVGDGTAAGRIEYKCTSPNCNKSYLRASDLHAHIQRRHPDASRAANVAISDVGPRNSANAASGTSAREQQYITSIARHVVAPSSGVRQYDALSRDEVGETEKITTQAANVSTVGTNSPRPARDDPLRINEKTVILMSQGILR